MSTVIGLMKKDSPLADLPAHLHTAGCGLNKFKILTNPADVHALLDRPARANCEFGKCAGSGALIGLALFAPVGLLASLAGCAVLGCSPLIWLFALGGLSLIGAGFGAAFGCFFGLDRFERDEHVYTEGVSWGNKLVVVTADTPDIERRAAQVLQQEHALAVKVLDVSN